MRRIRQPSGVGPWPCLHCQEGVVWPGAGRAQGGGQGSYLELFGVVLIPQGTRWGRAQSRSECVLVFWARPGHRPLDPSTPPQAISLADPPPTPSYRLTCSTP